jgi:RNA polymerase sigma-70 factor (ECF subfamily)
MTETAASIIEHFFRHESSKMTAVLVRLFGLKSIDFAEEIVQETLSRALQTWAFKGIPPNPRAWLYTAAKNKAIDMLRYQSKYAHYDSIDPTLVNKWTAFNSIDEEFEEDVIKDDQVRMIFACCHPELPRESQLAFALKSLCGFSVSEISSALLTTNANVNKRLYRAKEAFRSGKIEFKIPEKGELAERLDSVLTVLYLLFNEGYYSSHSESEIRMDLCEDAMRIAAFLFESFSGYRPLPALLALMSFQVARFPARLDEKGESISFRKQDRSLWNKDLIRQGQHYMAYAETPELSPYHIEAAIANTHCSAKSMDETNWQQIINLYNVLYSINKSDVVRLNLAIAYSELGDLKTAISLMKKLKSLEKNHFYWAAYSKFLKRNGALTKAASALAKAKQLAPTERERDFLERF